MIEAIKDMKHSKSSYESLTLERTANQILHHMEDKDSEDSLESTRARVLANARAIYGYNRCLDVISFAPTSSRKIGAAIVEHNLTGRSYIHCASAKENSRLAAVEHLLVITEDILQRLFDAEGISSSGWLPATPQAQHAAAYIAGSVCGSIAGSVPASRRSSVAPVDHSHDHGIPRSKSHSSFAPLPPPQLIRNDSEPSSSTSPQPALAIPRNLSDVIEAPKPIPVGQFQGHRHGRVQWNLGSEG